MRHAGQDELPDFLPLVFADPVPARAAGEADLDLGTERRLWVVDLDALQVLAHLSHDLLDGLQSIGQEAWLVGCVDRRGCGRAVRQVTKEQADLLSGYPPLAHLPGHAVPDRVRSDALIQPRRFAGYPPHVENGADRLVPIADVPSALPYRLTEPWAQRR
nr:hypothetical protein [Azospirillum brasilense]